MAYQAAFKCDQHPDPFECNDYLVAYSPVFDEYGLVLHDMHATAEIAYCPWCGAKLPKGRRREYFRLLEELGFGAAIGRDNDLPIEQQPDIPTEFKSDLWWRQRTTAKARKG